MVSRKMLRSEPAEGSAVDEAEQRRHKLTLWPDLTIVLPEPLVIPRWTIGARRCDSLGPWRCDAATVALERGNWHFDTINPSVEKRKGFSLSAKK
jgi:hypothetical protein